MSCRIILVEYDWLAESEWHGRMNLAESEWHGRNELGRIRVVFPWITLAESD